jgi:vitamin B12 transporter
MCSGGAHQLGLILMKSKNYSNALYCLSVFFTPFTFATEDNINSQGLASELETITVISSKIPLSLREIATSVSIINKEEIDARGNTSLSEVMRSEVGIGVSNSGGIGKNTTLRIRGEDGFRTKVYIDGVELSDPTAPQVTPIFDDILTHFIDRVEILRGPQGLMYGADAGGVVSITTKLSEPGVQSNIKIEAGNFSSKMFNADLGYANKNGHIYLAASNFETDGFNAQTGDLSNEKDGYNNRTFHLNTGVQLDPTLSLNLVVRHVNADNEYDGCYDNTSFALIHQCRTESENQTARLSLEYQQDAIHHTLAYAKTGVERLYFSKQQFSFGSEGEISKVEYSGSYELDQQKFIWGADNESQKLLNENQQRAQTGIYIEYQQAFVKQWFLTAGIRYDDNDTFGTHNSYRLSAAYLIPLAGDELIRLRSTYGTGFRAPSLYEQAYNDGDFAYGDASGLQLNEETSKGFDIGFDYVNSLQNMSIVLFKQSISNEIYFDDLGYSGYLQNVLSSDSKGAEFEFSQQVTQSLKMLVNYTFNEAQTTAGEARIRRPKHLANIGLQTTLLNDALNLNLSFRLVKDLVDIGGEKLNNYHLLNLTSYYQISEALRVSLRIENLFDREYQDVVGFNTASRAAYFGINFSI